MKKVISVICIVVLGFAGGTALYISEKHKSDILLTQEMIAQKQLTAAKSVYNSAVQASVIKMDSWKQYCDSFAPFCLKYPADWKLEANPLNVAGDQRMYVTITNPSKTATVSYINPLVKDGSIGSAHIIDVSEITISNQKLKLVGSYPISSGIYFPDYLVVDQDALAGDKEGTIGYDQSSSLFKIGKYTAISLSGYYSGSQKLTSQAQAKAWFQSVDGKTIKAVLSSFMSE